tara:strand:- start:246 stop:551 length:306 start_codon:yes stop_codon:yes gene_type:complete
MQTQCKNLNRTIEFTDHAVRRCQQRGIKKETAYLAAVYGKKTRAGHGLFKMFFTKSCILKTIRSGKKMRRADLEAAVGIGVIIKMRNGLPPVVVTVLPKNC